MSDPVDALPVWVINLDRSPDRMARMDEGLRAQGLIYKRIPAIDGRAEFDRLLSKVDCVAYERNMGQKLLPGKVGCYFSHLSAWQRLIDSGQEMALILEDDVVFHADFRDALAQAIKAKTHWDLLRQGQVAHISGPDRPLFAERLHRPLHRQRRLSYSARDRTVAAWRDGATDARR